MPIKHPRVLFIFGKRGSDTSTRFAGFVKRIQKNGGLQYADVDCVALEDLVFHIKPGKKARVYDPISKIDLKNYSFVYFKSWQSMPESAAAAAHFLEGMGIPYADRQVRHEYISKTTNYMTMWAQGVAVPETIWGSKPVIQQLVAHSHLDYPLIIKSVHGQKGKDNYLAKDKAEALSLLDAAQVDMVLQQFIPNDGDYRIGVYGHESRWGIFRRSGGTSHLNNTSAGGTAELLDIAQVRPEILRLAEAASEACDLAVSGVDVVEDKLTKELYVLEANQGSQIVTGAFTDSNMAAFDAGIKAMTHSRYAGKAQHPRQVIGRTVVVTIDSVDHPLHLKAKVDTGAYQSSLHVEHVEMLLDPNNNKFVRYQVKDPETGHIQQIETYEFWRALVRNSFGIEQERFVVPMHLRINGVQYDTRVSLSDRSTQKYPLLIGRKLLRGNFLVNVELGA